MHGTERIEKQKKLYPVIAPVGNMHTGSKGSVTLYLPPLLNSMILKGNAHKSRNPINSTNSA